MKTALLILLTGLIIAFNSCSPSIEEKAAIEKAKMDSVAKATELAVIKRIALEKAKQDSIAAIQSAAQENELLILQKCDLSANLSLCMLQNNRAFNSASEDFSASKKTLKQIRLGVNQLQSELSESSRKDLLSFIDGCNDIFEKIEEKPSQEMYMRAVLWNELVSYKIKEIKKKLCK